jgi:outer membrane protein assembly factor BamB
VQRRGRAASAAVVNGVVYVGSDDNNLYALNAVGAVFTRDAMGVL